MKRKVYIAIFSLLLMTILSVVLVFKLQSSDETINQSINVSSTIIGAAASVMTFILALLLFNKFGVENTIVEKRNSVVFSLLERLNSLTLYIENANGSSMPLRFDNKSKTYLEPFYGVTLIFSSTSYLRELERIFEIADSPYTPKSIGEKVEFLRFRSLTHVSTSEEMSKYAKIYVKSQRNEHDTFGKLNSRDYTLFEFVNLYYDLKDTIIDWIKRNSSMDISDLNV